MSEEEFKPIRITLSDEAFDRLDKIMKAAPFRSYSAAIEECIRVVSDIINDITPVIGNSSEPTKKVESGIAAHTFLTIVTRMSRFTNRAVTWIKEK